jgi:putative cell wall-binding protein
VSLKATPSVAGKNINQIKPDIMKKLLLIIAIAFAGLPAVTAQNVYVGDVLFDSQISIDGFIILYPNCTKIDGNVTIEETTYTDSTSYHQATALLDNGNSLKIMIVDPDDSDEIEVRIIE